MKYRCPLLFLCISLFASQLPLRAQTLRLAPPKTTASNPEQEELKSLIIRDIEALPAIQQVRPLSELGDALWDVNQAAALLYLRQAVRIALSPATPVASEEERLLAVSLLYTTSAVLNRDETSEMTLLSCLQRSILGQKKLTKKQAELAASIAGRILRKAQDAAWMAAIRSSPFVRPALNPPENDRKLAMEFALQSLKSPAHASYSLEFIYFLQHLDKKLAGSFFDLVIASHSKAKDADGINYLLSNSAGEADKVEPGRRRPIRTEEQRKALLGALIPFMREDGKKLSKGRMQNCGNVFRGHSLRDYYRTNFPKDWNSIDKAIKSCLSSNVPAWRKPGFLTGRPRVTVEDNLAIANAIDDGEGKATWITWAAARARTDKDLARAIYLLDQVEPKYRHLLLWDWLRVQDAEKYVEKLLQARQFKEAEQEIEKAPAHLQSRLLLNSVVYAFRAIGLSEWGDKMLPKLRATFERMDFPLTSRQNPSPVNPASFLLLVDTLGERRRNKEAIRLLEEFIPLQNLLANKYTWKEPNGDVFSYVSTLKSRQFLEQNLSLVCKLSGEIEVPAIRFRFRLDAFRSSIRNYGTGPGFTMKVN